MEDIHKNDVADDGSSAGGNAGSNLRRTPKQARAAATLARIEEAARVVLASVGRDRFTTSQVARQAGLGIGTLYIYFKDRVEVLDYIWPERRDSFYLLDDPY